MLTSLSIGNFKAFGETQTIPIRPITLIFGANSSGKSSIIHSLLLARHALDTGNWNAHRTALGGDSMDLGGFGAYVHRQDLTKSVELGLGLRDFDVPAASPPPLSNLGEIALRLEIGGDIGLLGDPIRDGKPRVLRGNLRKPGATELLSFVNPRAKPLHEVMFQPDLKADLKAGIDHHHGGYRLRSFAGILGAIRVQAEKRGETAGQAWALNDLAANPPIGNFENVMDDFAWDIGTNQLLPGHPRYIGHNPVAKDKQPPEVREVGLALERVNSLASRALQSLQYLGPLRSIPARYFEAQDPDDLNWLAGGASAWDALRRDKAVRDEVNRWLAYLGEIGLQTPYEVTLKAFVNLESALSVIAEELHAIRENFPKKSDFKSEEPARELLELLRRNESLEWRRPLALKDLRNGTVVSHRDVGMGISQVMPVLVHAYAGKKQTVAIEQPEIHLHPALQAELGDVFIKSARGERKNTFLLETHSEHLILRIMRRMRETYEKRLPEGLPEIRPEHVSVVYVEPGPNGSIAREMPLNERGELLKAWPGGFFEEGLKEVIP